MKQLYILLLLLFPGYTVAQSLYPAAVEKLAAARQQSSDPDEQRELDYLLALAAFQLQEPEALYILEDYPKKYPDARHIDELDYLSGCLRFDKAALDYTQGRYLQALPALSSLKERPLFRHHAAGLLMHIHFLQGDYAQALQESQALDPLCDDPETHRIVGECYYRLGDSRNARPHLQLYVEETEEPRRSSDYLLALCLFDEAEYHKATTRFRAVAANQTDTLAESARLYMVQAFFKENDLQAARVALESFLIDFPHSPYYPLAEQKLADLLFSFAKEAFWGGEGKVAVVQLSRVIDIARKYKGKILPEAYLWRAELNYRLGDYFQAKEDYRACLQQPGVSGERSLRAAATYGLAYCAFKEKDYNAALPLYRQYIALTPEDTQAYADALNRTADCLFYNRQFKQAGETYQRAAGLLPQNADYPLFQKAFIAGLEKDYSAKAAGMERLLRQFPQSARAPEALYEKGRAFVMLNKPAEAASAFETLMDTYSQSPLAPKAAVQLGLLHFNEGRLEKAIAHYKRVLRDYPGSAEAHTALHDLKSVYVEMNDVEGYTTYVSSLGGSVRLAPQEEDSLSYLAAERLLMREEDKAPAIKALQHYIGKYPQGAFRIQAEQEIRYLRVKALLHEGRHSEAVPDLEILSLDTQTPQGAEAKYLLAQYYYNEADDERTLSLLEDFAEKGTPHPYWLARAFILWADVYIRQGDSTQARVYLQNLQTNYKGENDTIATMILDRLNGLDPL
ncbi:MAG: tetratricopeptide repeat protein [Tannerellaceae bacterium]|nr:tetratricopeptide repeat protein [Tannerellaceae bacterium]